MAWENDKSTASDPDNPTAGEQLTADEWDDHVAEGHFLPDNARFGQNGDGDPIITDPQNGGATIMRYDRSAGSWVIDDLEADRATANNITVTQSNISSTTTYIGDIVTLPSSGSVTIFDVTGSVDIVGGVVSGLSIRIDITWEDGTTDQIYAAGLRAEDKAGDVIDTKSIPQVKDVSKLTVNNVSVNDRTIGYGVVTI